MTKLEVDDTFLDSHACSKRVTPIEPLQPPLKVTP